MDRLEAKLMQKVDLVLQKIDILDQKVENFFIHFENEIQRVDLRISQAYIDIKAYVE